MPCEVVRQVLRGDALEGGDSGFEVAVAGLAVKRGSASWQAGMTYGGQFLNLVLLSMIHSHSFRPPSSLGDQFESFDGNHLFAQPFPDRLAASILDLQGLFEVELAPPVALDQP